MELSIGKQFKAWKSRPRVISGLFSKEIKVLAGDQIISVTKDQLSVRRDGSRVVLQASLAGPDKTIELQGEAAASKLVRCIFRGLRPAYSRIARGALIAFVAITMINAIGQKPGADDGMAQLEQLSQANPSMENVDAMIEQAMKQSQNPDAGRTVAVQPDESALGLPPAPFTN